MATLSKAARPIEEVRTTDVLRMILDYGGGYLKVAAQHVLAGRAPEDVAIDIVALKPGHKQLEQILVLDGNKLWCGAREVKAWAVQNPDDLHKIIESPKLCLCSDYKDTPTARRVWIALDAEHGDLIAVQKLFTKHFRCIREATIEAIRRQPRSMAFPQAYWDSVVIESMITVPGNWDGEACGIFRTAASLAGLPFIDITLEPICAAAEDMERVLGNVECGTPVVFADIGKATLDIATVMKMLSAGGKTRPILDIIGTPLTRDVGAQTLQDAALDYVATHPAIMRWGGLAATRQRLGGMSEADFARRFSDEFEIRKKAFPDDPQYTITVTAKTGWQELHGQPNIVIEILKADMEKLFKGWMDQVAAVLKLYFDGPEQADVSFLELFVSLRWLTLGYQSRAVILTGASRQNVYVQERLTQALQTIGRVLYISTSESPVTQGGLHQYPTHTPSGLPTGFWCLTQNENWSARLHPDVTYIVPRIIPLRAGPGKKQAIERQVSRPIPGRYINNKVDKTKEVTDRIALFMSRAPGHPPKGRCIPRTFHVNADAPPRLVFDIYHSIQKYPEHDPLRAADGTVRPGFTKWPLQFADIPDPLDYGFKEKKIGKDVAYYTIDGIVEMHASETHLGVSLKLLCPGETLKYRKDRAGGYELVPNAQYRTFFTKTQELWDEHRNHAVLDGSGKSMWRTSKLPDPQPAASYPTAGPSSVSSKACPRLPELDDCDDEEDVAHYHGIKNSRTPSVAPTPGPARTTSDDTPSRRATSDASRRRSSTRMTESPLTDLSDTEVDDRLFAGMQGGRSGLPPNGDADARVKRLLEQLGGRDGA